MSVFISYRRGVTQDIVGRLSDRVKRHESVFHDVDSIAAGSEFTSHTLGIIRRSRIVLVVIGPDWLSAGNLHDEQDWVRREVQLALEQPRARVVPILVLGAELPQESELPPELRSLLARQAVRIGSGADFNLHVGRLLDELGISGWRRPVIVGGVLIALVGATALGVHFLKSDERGSAPSTPNEVVAVAASAQPESSGAFASAAQVAPSTIESARVLSRSAAQPSGLPTEAEVRGAVLRCWSQTEGGAAKHAASSAAIDLIKSLDRFSLESPAFDTSPRFYKCCQSTLEPIFERMARAQELSLTVILPGERLGPAFPTEAQARAALLACWARTEGQGSKAAVLDFRVHRGGGQWGLTPEFPNFNACARKLFDSYSSSATLADSLSFTLQLPAGTPAPEGSAANPSTTN